MELESRFESISSEELAKEIMQGYKESLGVDLEATFREVALPEIERIRKARVDLVKALLVTLQDVPAAEAPEFTKLTHDDYLALASDIELEPNLVISPDDLEVIKGYRGDQILTYLKQLTKRFENMSKQSKPEILAIELTAAGLLSVGIKAGGGAIKAYRAGATVRAAALAGVKGVGVAAIIVTIALIIIGFLIWLIWENEKRILSIVLNETESDLIVKDWNKSEGDLYIAHGEVKNFMQDQENLSSPKVQIKGGVFLDDRDSKIVFGGIYFVDRKAGLRGAEGVMIFRAMDDSFRFAHMFAVPYTKDNGTAMRKIDGDVHDKDALFRSMYDDRKVNYSKDAGRFDLVSCVSGARGGMVGCIARITAKG